MTKQIVCISIKQRAKSFQSVRTFVLLDFFPFWFILLVLFVCFSCIFLFLWCDKPSPFKYYKEISLNHYFFSTHIRKLASLTRLGDLLQKGSNRGWKQGQNAQEESINVAQSYKDGVWKAKGPPVLSGKPQIKQAVSSTVWPQSCPYLWWGVGLKTNCGLSQPLLSPLILK